MSIRIALVDDHTLFRNGMKALVRGMGGIEIVMEADNGQEFLNNVSEYNPDIVLMDLEMPVLGGIETTKQCKELNLDQKVIALTTHNNDDFIVAMLKHGARGYLLKTSEEEEVKEAIQMVYERGFYLNERSSLPIIRALSEDETIPFPFQQGLRLREIEIKILQLICEEFTTTEIADKLCRSRRTIDGYRADLLEKVGARNSVGLAVFAIRNGYFK